MPSRSAAGKSGSGGAPMLGEPWCQKTASRPSAPSLAVSYACRTRPSLSSRSISLTRNLSVPGTDHEDPHPLSLHLRNADATNAQLVYGIAHSLPSTSRSRRKDAASRRPFSPASYLASTGSWFPRQPADYFAPALRQPCSAEVMSKSAGCASVCQDISFWLLDWLKC